MATPTNVKVKIVELRAEGLSYAKIAQQLNVSKQTAVDVVRDNIDQVSTLQGIEIEALFDAKQVNARGRIEQLSALQTKLREEIERRDLTDVPTDKLIALFLKTSESLKHEVFTPTIQSTEEQKKAEEDRQKWEF